MLVIKKQNVKVLLKEKMLRNMMAMVMTVMMMICNVGDGDEEHDRKYLKMDS